MGEQTALASEDGGYAFNDLIPGPYQVELAHAHGIFYLTAPVARASGPYRVAVTLSNASVEDLDFGLQGTLNLPTFSGLTWKNAERVNQPSVRALIGETDCTGPGGILPTDQDPSTYQISVASAALLPGCGEPGDVISFTINGQPANETAVWEVVEVQLPDPDDVGRPISPPSGTSVPPPSEPSLPPSNRHRLDLTVGPAFAWWYPIVEPIEIGALDPEMYVEAFIDGKLCGRVERPGNPGALLVVPSAELEPGCGVEGAAVTLEVKGEPSTVTAEWQQGEQGVIRLSAPEGSLGTSSAAGQQGTVVTPPDVGDAGLR